MLRTALTRLSTMLRQTLMFGMVTTTQRHHSAAAAECKQGSALSEERLVARCFSSTARAHATPLLPLGPISDHARPAVCPLKIPDAAASAILTIGDAVRFDEFGRENVRSAST